ncbi:DUF4136 domain-containing protein [Altererythrobacter sp. CC-YST694]|uniref:DUF4136 domain-containing protein n=1 Tax=Altererythrobacter sp. CC-YST694 TaxID=2755038 RepID=UPI001D031428|nr:DUF4136 domain-containing protein [Altererythrobacter sp. CC-YST694]MCB5425731.1 DUF4136 domain-containing protein [Altererythrobacter sp. CC-YST694]
MTSKRIAILAAASAALLGLAGCMTPVGPVEVTRFHQGAAQLGRGTIAVEAAPGLDAKSLELATYNQAVARELTRLGYQIVPEGTGAQVAMVRLERATMQPGGERSPVSVGGGASVGSYGSGVGLGIGIDLSGKPKARVNTRLSVTIRDRASGQTLWEGRANFTVSASAPLAQTPLGAPRMAAALLSDFPGNNGETVEVK